MCCNKSYVNVTFLSKYLVHGTNSVDTLDKGMIHIPGETELDSTGFHHTAQKGMQFKTYELFLSVIFYLICLSHS